MRFNAHWWGIAVATIVGICTALPILVAPHVVGEHYLGIQYMPLDDEEIYRSRIHEILDGHFLTAQPYLLEYKSAPVPMPPINEWLYVLPAFVFGLSAVVVASKFLLPALIFFFAYLAIVRLTDDRWSAIAGGLLVFLSVELVDYGYLLQLLHGAWPRPLLWTRLVNPVVGAVELLVFINLLISTIERKWRFAPYIAGIVLALSTGYYFAFGISVALIGSLILLYALRRDFATVFELIKAGTVGFVLTLPYWYLVLSAIGTPQEAERS